MAAEKRVATLIAAAAVMAAALALGVRHGPVAGVVGGVAALLPGPSVALAVLGRPSRSRMVEFVCWSVGFGLACAVLCGLALNAVSAVTRSGWAMSFACVTVAAAAVHAHRTRALAERHEPPGLPIGDRASRRSRLLAVCGAFGAGLCTLVAAVAVSVSSANSVPSPTFSQLWVLGAPTTAHRDAVRLGVHSREAEPYAYRVLLYVNGARERTWSITLRPGQSWQKVVREPISADIAVRLFRHGQASTYRYATLSGATRAASVGHTIGHTKGQTDG